MNLRDIKKDIEYVLGAFIDDCSVFATVNPNAGDEELSGLLDEAIDLYNELKDKVNAKVEGPKGAYFSGLRKEVLEKTDALYEKLSEVVKKAAEAPKAPKAETAEKPAAEKKPATKKAPAKKADAAEKPATKKAPAKKPAAKKAE
ncbi:MAG: hypothetical protein MJY80_03360 [Bacteroidales bacterium]|nr:hypothetical protein [Bacteroidales bacterium]